MDVEVHSSMASRQYPQVGAVPPRRADWKRRTLDEIVHFYLTNGYVDIPEEEVEMGDMEHWFPRHAEDFPPVVTKVLYAAASGFMNDYQATASEQVRAQRLLMQCSPEQCSWAADAVWYLLDAGSYAHIYDATVLPNVVDELKKSEVNRHLVRFLLTRTDIDQVRAVPTHNHTRACKAPRFLHTTRQKGRARSENRMVLKGLHRRSPSQVLSEHGLPGSPSKTTIREHLHLKAPDDCLLFYGVAAPVNSSIRSLYASNASLPRERGLKTASGRPAGSSSSSSVEKKQKGDLDM